VGHSGFLSLRIDDDRSSHSRVAISFFGRGRQLVSKSYRSVPTNRWVRFKLRRQSGRVSGRVCVQGTDGTKKQSNTACARDVIR
jgi:hypothetical protein